jgi:Flp pilus assembly protein TadG
MTNLMKRESKKDWMRPWMQLSARPSVRCDEAGSALVELALMFPIFLILLVGSAEFGRLAYDAIEVANAARAGAAYASLGRNNASTSTANIALIQQAAIQDAPNVAGVTATYTASCYCSTGGTLVCTNALASCPSPARIIVYATVNTAATVGPLFNYPGLPHTFNLSGQAILRVEQ